MQNIEILSQYIPQPAAAIIHQWIVESGCKFIISKPRASKFGDYSAPNSSCPQHKISINEDLNPFAFLVTTVHEFAHLRTFTQYKRNVKPHGKEWKTAFKQMMQPFFEKKIFPQNLHQELARHLENPTASSCTDQKLYQVLKHHDSPKEPILLIGEIDEGGLFMFRNKVFRKLEKRRIRFVCIDIKSQKKYLFSPLAKVELSI